MKDRDNQGRGVCSSVAILDIFFDFCRFARSPASLAFVDSNRAYFRTSKREKEGEMSTLRIKIGGEIVKAELQEKEAPQTCRIIKEFAPLEGKLTHAKICDHEVYFQVPFFIDEKENPKIPKVGDIGFWNVRQTICIWYDNMQPLGPTNLFARITDNLEGFQREAQKVWLKQGTRIRFEVVK